MENDRDCEHCKHYVRAKGKDGKYEDYYMCEKWECEYEPERDCKTCKHSDNGKAAGIEECHLCMWESQYEPKEEKWTTKTKAVE